MTANAIQILRDLIAIPSVNPMRSESGEAVERGVADYIESALRRASIDCERQEVIKGRENVIAIVHPSSGGSESQQNGLMLNSHMDTVPVANMTIDPFDPVMRDGRIYGRGSCDAKGSIAAMLASIIAHANRPVRSRPIVFAAMVDEEFSFAGSWKLIERNWPVSAAVVGEPTRLASVIAHKGVARWRIKVRGVSAHAAVPHLGHNAIYDGARVALALEAYAAELAKRPAHQLLGYPTLNVGRVAGGQAVNMVPDICEFEIDRRLLPGEDGNEVIRDCQDWIRNQIGEDISLIVEDAFLDDPPLDTPRDAMIVKAVDQAHLAALGRPSSIEGAHYGTDGSKLARAGIETVVCGPGDIAQAHIKAEFVEIDQVEQAVRLYDNLIMHFAN